MIFCVIMKEHIKIKLDNSYIDLETIEVSKINNAQNEEIYQIKLKNIDGNGKLKIEFLEGTAIDKGNLENEFVYHFSNLLDASRFVGCEVDELIEELSKSNRYNDFIFANVQFESVIIDEYTYNMIVDYICKAHFIERDLKVPANKTTKMVLIEDDNLDEEDEDV